MYEYTPEKLKRFWSRVANTNNPDNCWVWIGDMYTNGYGRFMRKIRPHRYIYAFIHGEIPDKMLVCHRCDNRKCVNPAHLFLGTAKDNSDDMYRKGRQVNVSLKGEANPAHKLTSDKVIYLRERYARGGISQKELARELGVSRNVVRSVLSRKTWKHI